MPLPLLLLTLIVTYILSELKTMASADCN